MAIPPMPPMLRIVVADRQPEMQRFYRRMLPRMGYQLVAVPETESEALAACRKLLPDLLIMDAEFSAGDDDAFADQICRDCHVPILVLTAERPPEGWNHNVRDRHVTHLTKPVGRAALEAAIPLVIHQFQEFEVLSTRTNGSNSGAAER